MQTVLGQAIDGSFSSVLVTEQAEAESERYEPPARHARGGLPAQRPELPLRLGGLALARVFLGRRGAVLGL